MRRLYLCPTLLHLFNCILLEYSRNDHENADLFLTDAPGLAEKMAPLRASALFHRVDQLQIQDQLDTLTTMAKEERRALLCEPLGYFTQVAELLGDHHYTELYANQVSCLTGSVYYCMIKQGSKPLVHFVSDDYSAYILDLHAPSAQWLPHEAYGDDRLDLHLGNAWLHQPKLYSGAGAIVPKPIPSPAQGSQELRDLLRSIFGSIPAFSQKVIYLEGAFMNDGLITNEMQLFLKVTEAFGKENIIVKLHPHTTIDRFSPKGFTVMENKSAPWALLPLEQDLSGKLLVSAASFACLSAMEASGAKADALLMDPLLMASMNSTQFNSLKAFFSRAAAHCNKNGQHVWRPENINELVYVLRYLKGRMEVEQ